MTAVLLVLAGGLGAIVRAEVAVHVRRPYGTMVANVLGAGLLGALLGLGDSIGPSALAILGTGFAGGLTTFSTWMVEAAVEPPANRTIALVVPLTIGLFVAAVARGLAG